MSINKRDDESIGDNTGAQAPSEALSESRHGLQDLDQSDSTDVNYIFTDDEGSVESPLASRQQRRPDGGGLYASLASRYKNFGSDSDSQSSASNKSPATWTAYNQSKGREFARKMISEAKEGQLSRKAPADDASDTDNDSDVERAPTGSYGRHKAAGRSASSSSLLGMLGSASRRGRGLFATSKSAGRSAVDHRNNDFYDWEVQAAPRSLLSSTRSLRGDLWGQAPSVASQTTSQSNLVSRSVTSSVVASIIKEQRKRDKKVFRNAAAVCSDGLDCRLTADHVATMLQLGDDGDHMLSNLRGKSGAVEMEEPYAFYRGLPYLHLEGDVWIPHYEEYVVRTVDAFGRFLRKRTKAQRSGAS